MDASILGQIGQCFDHVPDSDSRAKIEPKEFLVSLIFCLSADSKRKSLDGLRREMAAKIGVVISRSSFWERMATNRLRRFLVETLSQLMTTLADHSGLNRQLLTVLKVNGIFLLDACSTSLPDQTASIYPAPRNNVVPSAIKWHFCMDLLSGAMRWYRLTAATEHDSQHFPPFSMLKGALIIFDLGYWDYQLLADLTLRQCFFLCRVKSNAIIKVIGISDNAPRQKLLGNNLMDFNWTRKRESIVEILGSFCQGGEELLQARVIGFWDPTSKCYHWYTTNLSVAAKLIYPAYRLRWQVELLFKGAKGSLRLEDIPSSNKNVIWSLVISTLISSLIAQPLARAVAQDEPSDEKKASISIQRAASFILHIAEEFRIYIVAPSQARLSKLMRKAQLLSNELFDPNYRSRETSIRRLMTSAEN